MESIISFLCKRVSQSRAKLMGMVPQVRVLVLPCSSKVIKRVFLTRARIGKGARTGKG